MRQMILIQDSYLHEPKSFTNGAYGSIYKGHSTKTKQEIVVKECRIYKDYAENEIKILQNIYHENIVLMLDWYYKNDIIWIVLEYCNGGELFQYCKAIKPNIKFTVDAIYQCAKGLHYLHSLPMPVIHRDVQPRNILLHKENDKFCVKLCDFGLSKLGDKGISSGTLFLSPGIGTELFKAPEVFDLGQCSCTLDTFSLGLVLESMYHYGEGQSDEILPVTAYPPNDESSNSFGKFLSRTQRSCSIVQHHPHDSTTHTLLKTLIDDMTRYENKERPTMKVVIDKMYELMKENKMAVEFNTRSTTEYTRMNVHVQYLQERTCELTNKSENKLTCDDRQKNMMESPYKVEQYYHVLIDANLVKYIKHFHLDDTDIKYIFSRCTLSDQVGNVCELRLKRNETVETKSYILEIVDKFKNMTLKSQIPTLQTGDVNGYTARIQQEHLIRDNAHFWFEPKDKPLSLYFISHVNVHESIRRVLQLIIQQTDEEKRSSHVYDYAYTAHRFSISEQNNIRQRNNHWQSNFRTVHQPVPRTGVLSETTQRAETYGGTHDSVALVLALFVILAFLVSACA